MVEFPSVFMQLKDLCSSTVCEQQTKRLKIIIDFETAIIDQLKEVGIMQSYSIERTAGRVGNIATCIYWLLAFYLQTYFST